MNPPQTRRLGILLGVGALVAAARAPAAEFRLLTGLNAGRYPGVARSISPAPGPGFANDFYDGDRLAGTSDVGPTVVYQGFGTPLYAPNHVGALSFLFRRGSVPAPPYTVPLMGVDFLGGPLLDLDGNTAAPRSLIPAAGQTPVEIPGSTSHIDLSPDVGSGTITLTGFDATGTNEGGPDIWPEIATVLVTLAGTTTSGGGGPAINPTVDTRLGTLTPYAGAGSLRGVYRIADLGFELWYDSIDPGSGSADRLGTLQHLGSFRGWLVKRDCDTGQFPALSGQGLDGTLWPQVNSACIGQSYTTAVQDFGPTATISDGVPGDQFTAAGNGGLVLAEYGGDLGAYFDNVVRPLLSAGDQAFVYLEAAGWGINNSGDPVFSDTTGYDVVLIGASTTNVPGPAGDVNGDGFINLNDVPALVNLLIDPGASPACAVQRGDVNQDGMTNGRDIQSLVDLLV